MVSTINQMLLTALRAKCKSSLPAVSLMVRITLWRQAKKLNYPLPRRVLLDSKGGWGTVETSCLPPIWPRFKSRGRIHLWVAFVVGN